MIASDHTVPATLPTAASPTAVSSPPAPPLALARVFVWETAEHAPDLARYFQRAGHPFVARVPNMLPAPVRERSGRGRVFELFTLPLDLSAILDSLHRDEVQRELEIILDLSDLPLLMVIRKKRPADPLHPERELRGILDLLPTWRPDGPADTVSLSPTTSTPTHTRARNASSLQAPFAAPNDDDNGAPAVRKSDFDRRLRRALCWSLL